MAVPLNLPLGNASFERVRLENRVFADKTRLVYDLIQTSAPYFLSRPRRSGKTLLVSVLMTILQ
ncbi:MAG: AAA family ATPase [Deltaproteobacteria bacterium]|nr:AAA family ATPase [Deltaproteobacteria bacterium]